MEVDESFFYRTKKSASGKGRPATQPKSWCFGLLHRNSNRVVYKMVAKRDCQTLLPIIAKHVHPRSAVVSDGWAVYPHVVELTDGEERSLDLTHEFVCHNVEFVSGTGVHINGIENTWSVVKRIHAGRYGTRSYLIQAHLDEAAARWNYGGGSSGKKGEFFVALFDMLANKDS